MNIKAPYFKIETFGAVDGPGTRLVIFLQGCPLRCIYCHNPESWSLESKTHITVDEVLQKYHRNISFYRNGGITISGGEPLLHQQFCLELAKKCKQNKISLAFDTSGCTFTKNNITFFKQLIACQPLWIIDIKHINKKYHKLITGTSNQNEISLIKFLEKNKQSYWIRQVLIPNMTNRQEDILKLTKFIKTLKYMTNFEILPYHKLGINKYKQLNIQYRGAKLRVPTKKEMQIFKDTINK